MTRRADYSDVIYIIERWENDEEENDALDKIPSSLIDERIFHTFMLLHAFNILTVCFVFDVKVSM
jgi:hypothetical protein